MELCQMLRALRHWRLESTQTVRVCTAAAGTPSFSPSAVSVCAQNLSSLPCPPKVIASSYSGSFARMSTCAWTAVTAAVRSAEKVIQPANMCPCGVISVNDSSSAYSTNTPVDSLTPPPMARSRRATSPGLMPVSAPANRLPFGHSSGKCAFQVPIACSGETVSPTVIRYVFCHILPKPWTGPVSRRPATFVPRTPSRCSTARRSTLAAQRPVSLGTTSFGTTRPVGRTPDCASRTLTSICSAGVTRSGPAGSGLAGSGLAGSGLAGSGLTASSGRYTDQRRCFVVVDGDRLIETGELEDLAVVVAEAVGSKLLPLPVGADQQRHEHADPAAVHVLQAGEVEHQPMRRLAAGFLIRRHQDGLAGRGDLALDIHHRHRVADMPDVHRDQRTVHLSSPLVTDPVASDPVASDPVASDPVASDPVLLNPVVTDPVAGSRPRRRLRRAR